MFVRINDYTSKMHNVTCSVSQGSVLAHLFFLLYINDIGNVIRNLKILPNADHLTLYMVVNNAYDAALLQQDLTSICNLAKSWYLDINLSKCKVIHFGSSNFTYYMNEMPATVSECEKILRVFVDNDLSFKTHIFTMFKKARQTCDILLTAFNSVDNIILISLYKIHI